MRALDFANSLRLRPGASELAGVVTVTFRTPVGTTAVEGADGTEDGFPKHPTSAPEVTPEVTPEVAPEVGRVIFALPNELGRQALQEALGLKDNEHFRKAYLLPAIELGFVEMTQPDKPRSSKQRYRLTVKGRRWIERQASADRGSAG